MREWFEQAGPQGWLWRCALAASVLVLPTAALGIFMRRRLLKQDAILWAIAGTFIVVSAVYVPATRYVAPMLFVPLFYSGVAPGRLRSTR